MRGWCPGVVVTGEYVDSHCHPLSRPLASTGTRCFPTVILGNRFP